MMKKQIYLLIGITLILGIPNLYSQEKENKIVINADLGKETISKHIYGHFTEHLGRCIYGGIWVGKDSPIP